MHELGHKLNENQLILRKKSTKTGDEAHPFLMTITRYKFWMNDKQESVEVSPYK